MKSISDSDALRRIRHTASEFLKALVNPFTYSPLRNHEVVFGFLWGLPIPFFILLIHAHAAGIRITTDSLWQVATSNPAYFVFFLHPFLFAILFGALGTMRSHRDQHIESLLQKVQTHCDELTQLNSKLTELDRLKTEFLANVTHELKSPLVTALGYNDRISGGHLGEVTEKQRKALDVSKRNLTRLRNLIEEILDFSRLESGLARFNFEAVSLDSIIRTAVESSAIKARERQLTVSVNHPSDSAMVRGDPTKLLQVVVNLMDNAIKFSPERGSIHISIQQKGDTWRLSVSDQGIGIAPDKLAQLFTRFFQVDGSLGRVHEGVGLGLVITKKIVEAHHGRISIESTQGINSGSTVTVELPVLKELDAAEITREVDHVTNTSH